MPDQPAASRPKLAYGIMAKVARSLGCGRANVSRVWAGHYKSERVARALAAELGRPVRELWPGLYPNLEKVELINSRGGFVAVLKEPSNGRLRSTRNVVSDA